jgi:hypothetical protein
VRLLPARTKALQPASEHIFSRFPGLTILLHSNVTVGTQGDKFGAFVDRSLTWENRVKAKSGKAKTALAGGGHGAGQLCSGRNQGDGPM